MRTRVLLLLVLFAISLATYANKFPDLDIAYLGPYKLGTPYDELKVLNGFKLDEKRTDPKVDIVAGKIIDRRILNVPTIQRLICKNGKLYRVSIIFGPPQPEWTEERVKGWLMRQGWPDPGPKEKTSDGEYTYIWKFRSNTAMILRADGGRWMASIMVND